MFNHMGALLMDTLPEINWQHDDDLCDCTFQRIGLWTNPYLARTMKVRFCCVWAELLKDYPQFVEEIPAFYNYNTGDYQEEPFEWDSTDSDMPRALWYRQIQTITGKSLEEVRERFHDKEPPRRKS